MARRPSSKQSNGMIEQKELPTTTGPDERHAGARRSKHEAVVRHDQRELVGIVEDLQC